MYFAYIEAVYRFIRSVYCFVNTVAKTRVIKPLYSLKATSLQVFQSRLDFNAWLNL